MEKICFTDTLSYFPIIIKIFLCSANFVFLKEDEHCQCLYNINSVTVKLTLGRIDLYRIILKANQMNYFLPCNFIRTTDLFEPLKTEENIHLC